MGKAASTMLTSMLCHACVLCWPGSFIISHFPYVYFENEIYYVYILYVSTIKYVTQKKRPTSRAQREHATSAIMIKNFINAGRKYAPGVLGLAHAQWRWHWVLACSPFHPFTRLFYSLTRSLLYYGGGAGVGVGHCGFGVFVGIGAFGDGVVFVCSLDLLAWGWCWCWRVRRLTCWRWCWCHWACSSLYSIAYFRGHIIHRGRWWDWSVVVLVLAAFVVGRALVPLVLVPLVPFVLAVLAQRGGNGISI